MIVTIAGKRYDFDENKLRLTEAYALKNMTARPDLGFGGYTVKSWQGALNEMEPDALAFLVWLVRTRAGEQVEFTPEALDFDLGAMDFEDTPDPTSAATSGVSDAATSPSSPTSSESSPETTPAA